MVVSKVFLLGLSAISVIGATAWWLKRRKSKQHRVVGVVSGLFVYPVKSCGGIALTEAECMTTGIKHDRSWVLVDVEGQFITARKHPALVLVKTRFEDDCLCLDAPGMEAIQVLLDSSAEKAEKIRIWRTHGEGQYAGDKISSWFSQYLGLPGCKFYRVTKLRLICEDSKWGNLGQPDDKLGFADFAPYLIATESSLSALNQELPHPVTMARFRPNIIVSGSEVPWAEDGWKSIRIGAVEFRVLKQCGRCVLTTVDPVTAKKHPDSEPLATLRRIRLPKDRDPRHGDSPLFGVHSAAEKNGIIGLGDVVMVSM